MTAAAFQLWSPGKLAADRQGSIYVVDGYKNCVREFDSTGKYRNQISLTSPSAVAAANGRVYIGSHSRHAVAIYRNGEVLGYLGARNNEFLSIADIAIDESTGDVYVVDTTAGQVKVYYASGIPKMTLAAKLHVPVAAFVTGTGVFVLDSSDAPCTQTADTGGSDDAVHVSACTVSRIVILDKNGSLVRNITGADGNPLTRALDIAVDRFENIYVADTSRKAILVFDRLGTFVGEMTSELDELRFPVALAVTPQGNILVASSETHSILEIDLSGTLRTGANTSLSFKSTTGASVPLSTVGF